MENKTAEEILNDKIGEYYELEKHLNDLVIEAMKAYASQFTSGSPTDKEIEDKIKEIRGTWNEAWKEALNVEHMTAIAQWCRSFSGVEDAWIPVEEKPKEPGYYFCYVPHKSLDNEQACMMRLYFAGIHWQSGFNTRDIMDAQITHWQPLPSPPKTITK